ncbi:MAG: RluA family pseudouridine synthase [Selenomonas sp.]|nr:RluA family pseudouridine synthase [Selenomonas sp.]
MTTLTVSLPPDCPGLAAYSWLRQTQHISRSHWRRLKNSGTFRINGALVNATLSVVHTGDVVSFESEKHAESSIEPQDLPLTIRYEDEALLVIDKPAGQLVHPLKKEPLGTVGNAVLGYYRRTGQAHGFHPVHRLDRNTTGLVLIAKEPQVQYRLTPSGVKKFRRDYLALIPGTLTPGEGTIDLPLGHAPDSFVRQMVREDGKPAITHYRTLRTGCLAHPDGTMQEISLLQLTLATGRTHQIRVHLAHLGHPLLGDDLYGGDQTFIARQALHACRLTFTHPWRDETVSVTAPLPADMQALLRQLQA